MAASQIATPPTAQHGTLGGNICLDTRCNYYDQNYEWRQAIGFCMKKEGTVCWVATSSGTLPRGLVHRHRPDADGAGRQGHPRVVARTARASWRCRPLPQRRHELPHPAPDEVLTHVCAPAAAGWTSVYWKLRRRGSFDFPVLSVAAAVKLGKDGVVEDARIVLGRVASRPLAPKPQRR
jgi:4-hydroxybenzoyl-CoA reductase subunit beta